MELWETRQIASGQCLTAQIGPLRLWLKQVGDELRMASERMADPDGHFEVAPLERPDVPAPEDLDWSRWVVGHSDSVLQLVPVMPDRPVVVRPEVPVNIPTGREALFFVSIPIWVRIAAGRPEPVKLCEQSSVVLSNTWFGDPMSGELCYSLRSRARREVGESEARPHVAVCPVRIRNVATTQLGVERFCVHADHLRTYSGTSQPWTNEVNITAADEAAANRVSYSQKPPEYEGVGRLLSEARTVFKKTLLKRSLESFSLSGGA